MKQTARVVEHEGKLAAEVVRSEACQSCHACEFGQKEKVYVTVEDPNVREGDLVELEIEEGSLSRASILAYGVPAALFLAALFLAGRFTEKDYFQALCALGGLAVGLLIVKLTEKKHKRSGKYAPKVRLLREEPEKK